MNQKIQPQFIEELRNFALQELKLDLIGITSADSIPSANTNLSSFLKRQYQGKMNYLENISLRTNPQELLSSAQSIIVIGINYYRSIPEIKTGRGKIARYAYGRDYHRLIKKILKKLSIFIQAKYPESENKICVDSSPIMEKSLAERAGLGFLGKNTLLINKQFGSWILLGELLTSLQLPIDKPITGTCGTCTRCIDICPTNAILQPGQMLDATKCISYLTIEDHDPIPQEFQSKMENWLFGCDLCQEVCPYNKSFQRPLQLKTLKNVKIAGTSLNLKDILNIKTDQEYLQKFAGSPLMRAKRQGLQNNTQALLNN